MRVYMCTACLKEEMSAKFDKLTLYLLPINNPEKVTLARAAH